MLAANTDNIKRWLDQSDIDYFTYFVKAWIPFNAWFRHTYDTLDQEREILNAIKSDGNKIRTRIMAKLEGGDPESEELRNHIAQLHRRLSVDPLEDKKSNRISFENVCVGKNPKAKETLTSYGWSYSVERTTGPKQIECTVINKNGAVVSRLIQTGDWDEESLKSHPDFQKLDTKKCPPLLTCYQAIRPWQFMSLLANPAEKKDFITMDGYRFIKDPSQVFAGLIDVLYSMRCLLFHGELVPDPQSNRTYEPAYHLVRAMIRCLV